uniref:Uncharacterized protein n=1 Tax=Cacopsylla melanoneura TaxID=428564 RepID=A0A8D8UJY9_9HEMI
MPRHFLKFCWSTAHLNRILRVEDTFSFYFQFPIYSNSYLILPRISFFSKMSSPFTFWSTYSRSGHSLNVSSTLFSNLTLFLQNSICLKLVIRNVFSIAQIHESYNFNLQVKSKVFATLALNNQSFKTGRCFLLLLFMFFFFSFFLLFFFSLFFPPPPPLVLERLCFPISVATSPS